MSYVVPQPIQANGASIKEGGRSINKATRWVEGSMATIQIPQETARAGLPYTRPPATPALGFLRLSVKLLQVGCCASPWWWNVNGLLLSVEAINKVIPALILYTLVVFLYLCVPGLHLALHPTQALGRLAPAATPPPSAPTPATLPSIVPSVAAAPGTVWYLSVSFKSSRSFAF